MKLSGLSWWLFHFPNSQTMFPLWDERKWLLSFPHPAPGPFGAALNTLSFHRGGFQQTWTLCVTFFGWKCRNASVDNLSMPSGIRAPLTWSRPWLAVLQFVLLMVLSGSLQQIHLTEQWADRSVLPRTLSTEHAKFPSLKSWNSFDFLSCCTPMWSGPWLDARPGDRWMDCSKKEVRC